MSIQRSSASPSDQSYPYVTRLDIKYPPLEVIDIRAIVDGHLAQDCREGPEPERLRNAFVHDAAVLGVADVARRCAAQVAKERVWVDVCHEKTSFIVD